MPTSLDIASRPQGETLADTPLAVFDLDGTLVRGNTFLAFLTTFARRHRLWSPLARLPFSLSGYLCRATSDVELKQRLMARFLGGHTAAEVDRHTDWFCQQWLSARLHPLGYERLIHHQESGHRVILLTASPDVYVPAIGRQLGITETICTRVALDGGHYTGRIIGPNCKGTAKRTALIDYLRQNEAPAESYAYGDSSHDLPVLRWVRHGYLVGRRRLIAVPSTAETLAAG